MLSANFNLLFNREGTTIVLVCLNALMLSICYTDQPGTFPYSSWLVLRLFYDY